MIKKILAYGDSFVQGGGLDPNDTMSIHKDSWPFQLAKILNVDDVQNRAVGGGSNKLSINRLLQDTKNIVDSENTLIVFCWTGLQRTCIYHESTDEWQNILVGHRSIYENYRKISDFYYELMYTDTDGLLTLIQQHTFVKLYLEHIKVKYLFANSFIGEPHLYNENQVAPFFREKYLFGYTGSIRDTVCLEKKLLSPDRFHPSFWGHKYVAKTMIEFMKNEGIINE